MFMLQRALTIIPLLFSGPAAAQLTAQQWQDVGLAVAENFAERERDACMRGENMTPGKLEHARLRTQQTMQSYFAAARSGSAFDAAPYFSRKVADQVWTGVDGQQQLITSIIDPMAPKALAELPEPIAFERAHDHSSAVGLWLLRASVDGEALGGYAASFRRARGRWLLTDLRIVEADAQLPRPYCQTPGDIDERLAMKDLLIPIRSDGRLETLPIAAPPAPKP